MCRTPMYEAEDVVVVLLLLALGSLLLLLPKDTPCLSTTVQAAGEPLQWVQPNITSAAPAALVQHVMVAQMGQGVA